MYITKPPALFCPIWKQFKKLLLNIIIVLKHFGLITVTLQVAILKWINSIFIGIFSVQYATSTHITQSSKYFL